MDVDGDVLVAVELDLLVEPAHEETAKEALGGLSVVVVDVSSALVVVVGAAHDGAYVVVLHAGALGPGDGLGVGEGEADGKDSKDYECSKLHLGKKHSILCVCV